MAVHTLSVVIPSKNRRKTLEATLEALGMQQGLTASFEVIVVDDGSDDDTSSWLDQQTFESFDFLLLRTDGIGPAGARNRGISQAKADRILLLGDDTLPLSMTLAEHLAVADGRQVGVQGRIEWDPSLEITEVMNFLAPEGPQFWFKGLSDGDPVPFTGVYGSNLSAPTRWFLEEPFDESYRNACFEDTEQAWRWSRRGWHVVYGEKAMCLHRHIYESIEPVLDRQIRAGAETRFTIQKHPRLVWRLLLQPLIVGGLKAISIGLRAGFGRGATVEEKTDLRCRMAWARGLLGFRANQSSM